MIRYYVRKSGKSNIQFGVSMRFFLLISVLRFNFYNQPIGICMNNVSVLFKPESHLFY